MSCPYYTFKDGDYYCIRKESPVNDDTYYKYCRNYDYDSCPIYKHEDTSSGCFLTSACVEAKGLPDNCHELETLRSFRDNWLSATEEGSALIQEYYAVAPAIVEAINASNVRMETYEMIYEQMVLPCVKLIEDGQMEAALELYQKMTLMLKEQFCGWYEVC